MKVIALLFAAVVAVTSVYATAAPEAGIKIPIIPDDPEWPRWCYRPGQPCWKAKRALEEINQDFAAHFGDEE